MAPKLEEISFTYAPKFTYLIYYPSDKKMEGVDSTVSLARATKGVLSYVAYKHGFQIRYMWRDFTNSIFSEAYLVPKEFQAMAEFCFATDPYISGVAPMAHKYAVFNVSTGKHIITDSETTVNQFSEECEAYVAYCIDGNIHYLHKPRNEDFHWLKVKEGDVPSEFISYVLVVNPSLSS